MPENLTNTPSKEEVAKAQEWLEDYREDLRIRDGSHKAQIVWALASYAAEQRIESAAQDATAAFETSRKLHAAESRLTSLREGLRPLIEAARRANWQTLADEAETLLAEKKES